MGAGLSLAQRGALARHRDVVLVFSMFALVVVVASLSLSGFTSVYNVGGMLGASLPLALAAIGQTVVVLTGGIDLSIGSVMSLTAVVGALYIDGENSRLLTGILICVGLGAAIGLVNGLVVTFFRVNPVIATLGTLSIGQGLALTATEVPGGSTSPTLREVVYGHVAGVPAPVFVLVVAFAVAYVVLRRTRFGLHVYALGGDEEGARLSEIRTDLVKTSVYVISGACAGLGGLLLLARLGVGDPVAGQFYLLLTVVAIGLGGIYLFGGRGSVIGTLGGVAILAVLGNALNAADIGAYEQDMIYGLLVIGILAIGSPILRRRIREWSAAVKPADAGTAGAARAGESGPG